MHDWHKQSKLLPSRPRANLNNRHFSLFSDCCCSAGVFVRWQNNAYTLKQPSFITKTEGNICYSKQKKNFCIIDSRVDTFGCLEIWVGVFNKTNKSRNLLVLVEKLLQVSRKSPHSRPLGSICPSPILLILKVNEVTTQF